MSLWIRLRWWIDDKRDAKYDSWNGGFGSKWRWWVARQVNRLPGQCWSDLADFGLGRRYAPWQPRTATCVTDAQRTGACYCGKVARADVVGMPGGPQARVVVPRPEKAS